MKISYVVPGTFHGFDVANELNNNNILDKIYTPADILRVYKWKKELPFNKISYSKWPILRRGKIKRNGDDVKILNNLFNSYSDVIVGYPNFSELIFKELKNKIKILDIDHFNWDEEICKYLKSYKLDFFNCNNPLDSSIYTMQKSELEKELSLRNISYKINLESQYQKALECELADIVMVPVSFVRDTLIAAGLQKEKIFLNPYGYDEKIFYRTENKKYPTTVMYGGSISYRKGWVYLKDILKSFNNTEVQIIVAGGIESNIEKEVKSFFKSCSPNIRYIGSLAQKKLAYYMRNVGIFLFPSVLEGFGMTILQAMASGTTVISSKATCGIDLIKNDINGYVIEKENTKEWIKIINELVNNNVKLVTLGKKAYSSVSSITWNNYVNLIKNRIEGE